jgi:hypothetical protein
MIEHLLHIRVEFLDVLVRFVGQRIACSAAPDQFLSVGIEQVDDQRATLYVSSVVVDVPKPSPNPPPQRRQPQPPPKLS